MGDNNNVLSIIDKENQPVKDEKTNIELLKNENRQLKEENLQLKIQIDKYEDLIKTLMSNQEQLGLSCDNLKKKIIELEKKLEDGQDDSNSPPLYKK
ncbi:unnamed protein product [Rotaria sordida]|uniref:Uncharacterized protein n=1 Tax=Rotaria sordida TaxID=392033 RepID=A0A816EWJ5_9BILA|nr:unnamed protein product [Rotaria sordida]CAF1499671.1 unnamed protein product [Rotaria sordida]CAF1651484.1 unnamed protein product [Rotaria sordida]CAF4059812.1 unnamed protein product [Rotaria sordida]